MGSSCHILSFNLAVTPAKYAVFILARSLHSSVPLTNNQDAKIGKTFPN